MGERSEGFPLKGDNRGIVMCFGSGCRYNVVCLLQYVVSLKVF